MQDVDAFRKKAATEATKWEEQARTNSALNEATARLAPLAEQSRDLVPQADLLCKLASRLINVCENELEAKESNLWVSREIAKARKTPILPGKLLSISSNRCAISTSRAPG